MGQHKMENPSHSLPPLPISIAFLLFCHILSLSLTAQTCLVFLYLHGLRTHQVTFNHAFLSVLLINLFHHKVGFPKKGSCVLHSLSSCRCENGYLPMLAKWFSCVSKSSVTLPFPQNSKYFFSTFSSLSSATDQLQGQHDFFLRTEMNCSWYPSSSSSFQQ